MTDNYEPRHEFPEDNLPDLEPVNVPTPQPPEMPTPLISNKLYDALNGLNKIVLPAVGTAYFALAKIWGFPKPEEVVGSIAVLATFVGVILLWSTSVFTRLSSSNPTGQYDGSIEVSEREDGGKLFALNLNRENPEDIANMKQVVFKIKQQA